MPGCRPLTDKEVQAVLKQLDTSRNKALFVLGVKTGLRISELLSLKVGDVVENGKVVDRLRVKIKKTNPKAKIKYRDIPLHQDAKDAITTFLNEEPESNGEVALFSRIRNGEKKAISAVAAHLVLKKALKAANVTGRTGWHMTRKSFAAKMYKGLGRDVIKTRKALGHVSLQSTLDYLEVDQDEIDDAILS